jgi:hypothetical protein
MNIKRYQKGERKKESGKIMKSKGIVTKIENIKTDETKILRPTDFSGKKNIKTDRFFVGLNL